MPESHRPPFLHSQALCSLHFSPPPLLCFESFPKRVGKPQPGEKHPLAQR